MNPQPEIAVIIPVSERYDDVRELYVDYKTALDAFGRTYQFTYVLDGAFQKVVTQLESLREEGAKFNVIRLSKWFGEATALSAGFENSTGEIILTLPAYYQVEPAEVPKLLAELDKCDMVIGRRFPRVDSRFNRMQTRLFNWILKALTGTQYRDLGCGVRAFRRQISIDVPLYGDQHRFLPLLADRQGFRVREVDLTQSRKDSFRRVYGPGIYPRRLLDILTVFFLIKFTKKPLRFFGLIGATTFAVGAVLTLYLVLDRFLGGTPLAERPALLLSSLLMVLGVQIFALGLIGELIIFSHARDLKEYTIEQIIN